MRLPTLASLAIVILCFATWLLRRQSPIGSLDPGASAGLVVSATDFASWSRALADGVDVTLAARAHDPASAPRELGRLRTLGRLSSAAEQWLGDNITSSIESMERELRELVGDDELDSVALVRQAFLISVIDKAKARLEILRRRDYWTVAQGDAQRLAAMPPGVLIWTQPVIENGALRDVVYPIRLCDFPAVTASMEYLDQVRRTHAAQTAQEFNQLPLERRRELIALRSRRADLVPAQRELVEQWFPPGVNIQRDATLSP